MTKNIIEKLISFHKLNRFLFLNFKAPNSTVLATKLSFKSRRRGQGRTVGHQTTTATAAITPLPPATKPDVAKVDHFVRRGKTKL